MRLLVIIRLLGYTLRTFVRPKTVERIKLDNEVLPAAVISTRRRRRAVSTRQPLT